MSNRFTDKAEEALNSAVKVAEEHGHTYIGSEHILLSLCRITGSSASVLLHKYGIIIANVEQIYISCCSVCLSGFHSAFAVSIQKNIRRKQK